MEKNMLSKVIVPLAVVALVCFVVSVSSCNNARVQKNARDKEMATRMEVEEKLNKYLQEGTDLSEKLKKTQQALDEEKAAHQSTQQALEQEQLVNQSLKEELKKVTKLNEALEQDLKGALTSGKSSSPRK